MSVQQLLRDFAAMKAARRRDANFSIAQVGRFGLDAHQVLLDFTDMHSIAWAGSGPKQYHVHTLRGKLWPWSRGVNTNLFIPDQEVFTQRWGTFEKACRASASSGVLDRLTAIEINTAMYTAVMSWAVAVDLFNPSRGLAGTYFEMLLGPVVSSLTGRPETGDIQIALGKGIGHETIKVDLTFHDSHSTSSLCVPTKISTRERISQAYVHAAILHSAFPGRYKTILGVVNENNAFHRRGVLVPDRSLQSLYLTDTLVPGTIVLYQKYIARLYGLYYLDPPYRYLHDPPDGFPKVADIGQLLTQDLLDLL